MQLVGRNALFVQAVDFAQHGLGVDHHARTYHICAVRIQNARRNELQLVFDTVCHDRVAGIIAALTADNQVSFARENINKLALAFVAPLGAENYLTWHRISFLSALGHAFSMSYS